MSILFGLIVSSPAPLDSPFIPLEQWQPEAGDRFIVDTRENVGYLVHENGHYTATKVGSGKQQIVRYIGRVYDATTPDNYWVVQSSHIQPDRITFGETGRFLRLYDDGVTYTAYGIHPTANIDEILAGENRYKSMGCVLVSEAMMDILMDTYALNGERLEVVTRHGIDDLLLAYTP